jgi:hypothetical protein
MSVLIELGSRGGIHAMSKMMLVTCVCRLS